jgi:hypothetical protein
MTNNAFADATPVVITTGGGTYTSPGVDNTGYTIEAGEDGEGYRSAWWTYTPTSAGSATVDTQLSTLLSDGTTPAPTQVTVTQHPTDEIDSYFLIAFDDFAGGSGTALATFDVEADTRYRIRISQPGNAVNASYVLRVTGPQTTLVPIDAPPMDVSIEATGNPPLTNDLFARAAVVVNSTGTWQSASTPNNGYGTEPGEPVPAGWGRSAWWSYTPRTSGTATFSTEDSPSGTDTYLTVYTGSSLAGLTQVGADDNSGWDEATSRLSVAVTANTTYHVQVTAYPAADKTYVLTVTGPVTTFSGDVPVMEVTARAQADPVLAVLDDAPPMDATATADPGQQPSTFTAAPADGYAAMPAPSVLRVRRLLTEPLDGAVVPVDKPTLMVTVAVVEGLQDTVTVDVQYASDAAFTAPTTLTRTFRVVFGDNPIRLQPAAALAGTVYWRARLTLAGTPLAWTPARHFRIDTTAGDATCPLIWTPLATDTDGHLWWVDPASGRPGDLITVVGQGLAYDTDVTLTGVAMEVVSRTRVAATPAAGTDARAIDALAGVADPEHDVFVVRVPDTAAAPGGPLLVEDD